MPICEYCGDEFTKGGAYATHVRYCDARQDRERTAQRDPGHTTREDDSPDEGGGDETGDALAAELADEPTDTESEHREDDTEMDVATADPSSRPADREAAAGRSGPRRSTEWASRRLLGVLLLAVALVIVWRVLRGREKNA